ncbi:MAG: hypothetical protein RJB01_634 [Actinomycetota bacterium]|jgi:molybdopterin converting factor small subunit
MHVRVRLFAAARAAAGSGETFAPPGSVESILAALTTSHPGLGPVLPRCSYLVDGAAVHGMDTFVPGGSTLDVLPPFAGG